MDDYILHESFIISNNEKCRSYRLQYGIALKLTEILLDKKINFFGISGNPSTIHHHNYHYRVHHVNKEAFPVDILPEKIDGLVYSPGTIKLKPLNGLKESEFLEDFKNNV